MKTYVFVDNVRKRIVRSPSLRCAVCGSKTKRIAFFDIDEVYLIGECPDNAHGWVEYPWPTVPADRMFSPHDAEQLGFEVHQ